MERSTCCRRPRRATRRPKRLYRELARRFSSRPAEGAAELAYRTSVMTAVNSAYTAGDIRALYDLAGELDRARFAVGGHRTRGCANCANAFCNVTVAVARWAMTPGAARDKTARLAQRPARWTARMKTGGRSAPRPGGGARRPAREVADLWRQVEAAGLIDDERGRYGRMAGSIILLLAATL